MSTVLIIIVIVLVLVVGISLALGRATYEVDSARDTEYLELEGVWIRYDVMGGGPPVVLVHGWLSSSAVWDQIARRLAQRFTVYTLDLTGFGESDKPLAGYGIRYGSRLLYAFCAHFGLNRASIIGHDLGGAMAMKLASDHPDVVGRIVLVATPANEEQIDLPTPLWAATLPVVGPIFYALGRAARPVRSLWMRPFVLEPEDVTEEMLDDAASSTPAAMRQALGIGRREIGGGRLARQSRIVRVPVMIITGEDDQIVDPQAAGVWARSLEQAEVCLMDECGHMPMIEHPGEFNAQILAFLTGDARYLEQVERDRTPDDRISDETDEDEVAEEEISDEDFERRASGDEVDTMEVDIQPGVGEEPAFGGPLSESEHDDFDEREVEATRDSEEEEFEREEDDPPYASRLGRQTGRSETPPRRETSRDEEDERDEADEDSTDRVIRRLGEAFSGRSSGSSGSRRPTRSERAEERRRRREEQEEDTTDLSRFTAGMTEDDSEKPVEAEEHHTSDFYTPGDPESSSLGETGRYAEPPLAEPTGVEPEREPEPEKSEEYMRRERPRRRPRRESASGEGAVPEVPGDLFDWGDSLDDFEPTRRRPRKDEPGDGVREDRPDEEDPDPPGDPFRP